MVFTPKKAETPETDGEKNDIAAPKKKAKKEKPVKKLGPKLVPSDLTKVPAAGVGHNGEAVPALKELMDEDLQIDEQKKAMSKAQRDIRNRAKTEFGISAKNWNDEKGLRKLDADVRIQFESGRVDLRNMLGYQAALDLQPATVARTENELVDPGAPKDDIINRKG